MILVDTSVWVNHFRSSNHRLCELLSDGQVVTHPFILGELACGNLRNRDEILSLLQSLPMAPTITIDEFLYFVEQNQLMSKGIGFVDVHLLASAKLAAIPLWTLDRKLNSAAKRLAIGYHVHH